MRVCYQVHTHRAPAQIHRLVRTLVRSSPECVVVISHDRLGPELDEAALSRLGDVHVLPTDGGYGDWSHVRRYLEVADLLAERGIDYDWMANLTGQDYPVRPLGAAEAELAAADVDGFLLSFPVESEDAPWPHQRSRSRYWYRYRRLGELSPRAKRMLRPVQVVNRVQPMARVNVSFGFSVGVRARAPFAPGFACHGGSFWCTLSRKAVERLREFTAARPDVVAHYQRTLAPDESYFHTVLSNTPGMRFSSDCLRYFDFSQSTFNHPKTLDESDVAPAAASGAHFARKWDLDRNPEAYDMLDTLIFRPRMTTFER
jgi:hypothetical protein